MVTVVAEAAAVDEEAAPVVSCAAAVVVMSPLIPTKCVSALRVSTWALPGMKGCVVT